MPPTDVAVVIPVRNGAAHLGAAIESALTQTVPPSEVVVVDHGSEDDSGRVARSFGAPVRCLSAVRAHAGPPRNEGIEASTAPVLTFLDADDLWAPDKLELQLAHLEGDPGADLVFGAMEEFVSPDVVDPATVPAPRPAQPAPLMGLMMMRRATFEAVGPFREDLVAQEYEWLARARSRGLREATVDAVLLRRRIHQANHSRQPAYRAALLRTVRIRRTGDDARA